MIAPIDHDVALRLATDKRFGQRSAEQLIVDPLPELKTVIDDASRKGATVLTFNSGGAEQRAVATWLDSKPWIYVVAMSPASYTSSVAGATPGLIGGVALALALAVLVAILLVRSMVARGEAER